ncbi:MAG TPA: nuclear transport factor 2 family protein [Actinocrinis sp.]|nr:nuclear transport factor 2 family protein [Actinocrinis sp.]
MSDRPDPADLAEIHQVLALFPHVFDTKDEHGLGLVFSADAEIELTRGAGSVKRGLAEIRAFAQAIADDSLDHHTLNTVVFVDDAGVVRARSRYLAILADQSVHNGDYYDTLVHTPDGWRIRQRISVPRFPQGGQVPPSPDAVDAWHRWIAAQDGRS